MTNQNFEKLKQKIGKPAIVRRVYLFFLKVVAKVRKA